MGGAHCRSSTAHRPQAAWQCIARIALPTTPRQGGSALQDFHSTLPPGSEALYCRSSTAHCPQAVWQCIAGAALPTAPRRCGSALQELHCPLPPGSVAVHSRSSTAHCPLPTAHKCSAAGHRQCSAVHSTKQCGTAYKVLMVQHSTHGAVGPLDPV